MNASALSLIECLCSIIESKDMVKKNHNEHVRRYTELMLEKVMRFYPDYGLTAEDCDRICKASIMHDIGKISVPDKIRQKPSRLNEDEYLVVKNHTKRGKQIFDAVLATMSPQDEDYKLFQYCAEICMYHHERYDGNGYPMGLKGDDIPIAAQIVGLADAYDSLVSERIFKNAYSREHAFDMIVEGDCGVFSTRILEVFRMVRLEMEEILEKEELQEK